MLLAYKSPAADRTRVQPRTFVDVQRRVIRQISPRRKTLAARTARIRSRLFVELALSVILVAVGFGLCFK